MKDTYMYFSKIQGKVVEIASLQEVFTDKVLEQVSRVLLLEQLSFKCFSVKKK